MNARLLRSWSTVLTSVFVSLPLVVAADSPPPAEPEKKPEPPSTHTIQRGRLTYKIEFGAQVEAVEMKPVSLAPKAWTELTVVEVVPHGKRVTRGEVLLRLDPDKLEKQIAELEQQRPASELALELGEAELENLQQTTPLKLEAARRGARIAAEDYEYFQQTGRAQKEKGAQFGVRSAEQRLEGAREELEQLQKMYEADDLTEETEEIVLRRQKQAVEAAEFALESVRLNTEFTLSRGLSREQETLLTQKRDQTFGLELAEFNLPRQLAKKRLDMARLKQDRETAADKLAELKHDLKLLRVVAPMDGTVYYGACEYGKWTTGPAVAKKLVPGGKLVPHEVLMTVVNPARVQLRAAAPEGGLGRIESGLKGTAAPTAAPGKKLEVRLDRVSFVPLPTGGFDTVLSVEQPDAIRLMPGMTCQVGLATTSEQEQLLAPKTAVFEEAGQSYVFLARKDAQPEKRTVKVGDNDENMVEIRKGLAVGDQILLKKPE